MLDLFVSRHHHGPLFDVAARNVAALLNNLVENPLDEVSRGKSVDERERRMHIHVGRVLLLKTLELEWAQEADALSRERAVEIDGQHSGRSGTLLRGAKDGSDLDRAIYRLVESHKVSGIWFGPKGEHHPVLLPPFLSGRVKTHWRPTPNLTSSSSFPEHFDWLLQRLGGTPWKAVGPTHREELINPTVKKALKRLGPTAKEVCAPRREILRAHRRRTLPKTEWPTCLS